MSAVPWIMGKDSQGQITCPTAPQRLRLVPKGLSHCRGLSVNSNVSALWELTVNLPSVVPLCTSPGLALLLFNSPPVWIVFIFFTHKATPPEMLTGNSL